ncbi:type II toxin-antitoxin system VapC family toxin [Beijerinckia sp. L45]|uniref:type II toxin-antitoxin system VapC family toxin n=1 Tax=Beijerinckia sp. L45 TaxID=1641855 RepID=UPI00131E34F9|nr:type II toxin-antitoxin system VapC family toxin [Beijerinckia sp. L45]
MIFADASALIAIITGEPEADTLADVLQSDPLRRCSALSVWETVTGLNFSYGSPLADAREQVQRFLDAGTFGFVPIGETEYALALDARARFGKGRHPAGLNMGDCFAYACAKANRAKLLYKGSDFAKTDLA